MNVLSTLKRYLAVGPAALLCGLSYARFLYWSRHSEELDAEITWNRFTKPQNNYVEWLFQHYPPAVIRKLLVAFYPRLRDRIKGIAYHYDISNDFYRLFLDRDYMFYTCADFLSDQDTIEIAQHHKADFILNLIDPKPGERILDLGCGWGSMMKRVYEKTGDRENLHGYTLSVEQKRFIDQTYGFNVEMKDVVATDYAPESWDKIYSVGCMEHVPKAELLPLHKKLARTIKPTGHLVHHFFCQMKSTPSAKMLACDEIFPGVELATWQRHVEIFEAAGLRVAHHSVHDYRPTLKAWYDRLVENRQEAIRLVGVRTYNRYLCYLAEAWRIFDDRDLLLMRFVLTRQDAPTAWESPLYRTETSEQPVRVAEESVLQTV